ncbi:hypothetical protein [Vulgatibacter sp.]|uniref:hypothetical protein n=1 Tax=Vulgatibacter sp. TaxID=1971226 RepID=UPI003568B8BD
MRGTVAFSLAFALALASACGGGVDERGPECELFPDSCSAGSQCYPGDPELELTVCLAEGQRALGEACDAESDDFASYCGRELLCVAYGTAGTEKLCSPLCATDAECAAAGLETACEPGDQTGLKFCSLR